MRAWIYRCKKTELIDHLRALGLDTQGGIDELRKRLREFSDQSPDQFVDYVTANYSTTLAMTTAPRSPQEGNAFLTPAFAYPPPDTANILSQMRKWGCIFDGRDPLAFLERIEELNAGYGFSGENLLRGLPELLRGESLLWYRNNRTTWQTWEAFVQDFRAQYLPYRYQILLKREIEKRSQKPGESFAHYETEILTKIRRAGGYADEEKLMQVYDNLLPEYKLYIRISEVHSLRELSLRAREFEAIKQEQKEYQSSREINRPPTVAAALYDRATCCWRCKQRGHTRNNCQRAPKKFCSQCGKDGVLTRECHPRSGNGDRAGPTDTGTRPTS